jgi:hypothetical protein
LTIVNTCICKSLNGKRLANKYCTKHDNEYPCFLGHYYLRDSDYIMTTDMDNVTHVNTKCIRCGKIQILHLNNKKAI